MNEAQAVAADLAAAAAIGQGASDIDERRAESLARHLLGLNRRERAPFPVEALGPLADAADVVAGYAQLDAELVGASVLCTASFVAQPLVRVLQPSGLYSSCGILALVRARSGAGKSTAERILQRPIQARQRVEADQYAAAVRAYTKAKPKAGDDAEPPQRSARYLMQNPTPEGIARLARDGARYFGIFTSEAATMTEAGNMRDGGAVSTMAALVSLYDSGSIVSPRAGSGATEAHGLSLSGCLMGQPSVIDAFARNERLLETGGLARFLLFAPERPKPRTFSPSVDWHSIDAIRDLYALLDSLIAKPVGCSIDSAAIIGPDANAAQLFGAAFEEFDAQARTPGGELEHIEPLAIRSTELAYRIGGIYAAIDGRPSIDADAARNALALVRHSLGNWTELLFPAEAPAAATLALCLYLWLVRREGNRATLAAIASTARPNELRRAATRDALLARLAAVGLVSIEGQTVAARFPHPPTLGTRTH